MAAQEDKKLEHLSLQYIFLKQVFEQTQSPAAAIQNARCQMWMFGPLNTSNLISQRMFFCCGAEVWNSLTRVNGHQWTFIIFFCFCTHPQRMTLYFTTLLPAKHFFFMLTCYSITYKYGHFCTAALFGSLLFQSNSNRKFIYITFIKHSINTHWWAETIWTWAHSGEFIKLSAIVKPSFPYFRRYQR